MLRVVDYCRVSNSGEDPATGQLYEVSINAASSLRLALVYSARTVAAHAFALPLALHVGAAATPLPTEAEVRAECLATRVTVSSASFDFGACIIPGASSMRPPYEKVLTLTNEQDNAVQWSLGEPSTNAQAGCTDVFVLQPRSGELPPRGSVDVKVCNGLHLTGD